MTIGEKLKRERKKMGHDLDSVAQKTKIAKMFLIAIENDDLSSLPGGVYTRNFLRAYAKFLNLDEDIITAEYHEQYDVKPHFVVHQEQTKRDDGQFKRQRSRFFLVLFLLALIISGIVVVSLYFPFWKKDPAETTRKNTAAASQAMAGPIEREPAPQNQLDTNRADTTTGGLTPNEQEGGGSLNQGDLEVEPGNPNHVAGDEQNQPKRSGNVSADEVTQGDVALETEALTQGISSKDGLASSELPFASVAAIKTFIAEKGLQPTVFFGAAEALEQVFIIEALAEVDIEVYIDGVMATRRLLMPGQIRFYSYGNYNRVIIKDLSRVNIQDGNQVFSRVDQQPQEIFVNDFEPGQFLTELRKSMKTEL